jgi:hypothetical protein
MNKSKGTKRAKKDQTSHLSMQLSESDRMHILRLKTGVRAGACKGQGGCKVGTT